MTVQTATGAPVLDSGDFHATTNGISWGLKLRYAPAMDASSVLALMVVESGEFKEMLVNDFESQLNTMGVQAFMTGIAIPAINAWFRRRFGSDAHQQPGISQLIADLDEALRSLAVTIEGVKQ